METPISIPTAPGCRFVCPASHRLTKIEHIIQCVCGCSCGLVMFTVQYSKCLWCVAGLRWVSTRSIIVHTATVWLRHAHVCVGECGSVGVWVFGCVRGPLCGWPIQPDPACPARPARTHPYSPGPVRPVPGGPPDRSLVGSLCNSVWGVFLLWAQVCAHRHLSDGSFPICTSSSNH